MRDRSQEILDGLNEIFRFLGVYGGIITIDEDWDFSLYVHDEGIWNELESGEYEIEMASSTGINGDHVVDPLFWIVVKFDEAHEKVVSAKATGYRSEWPGGWMEIDKDNNVYDDTGVEHMEGELEERLCNYLETITKFRPYLRNPVSVERFDQCS